MVTVNLIIQCGLDLEFGRILFRTANRCAFKQNGFSRAVNREGDIYTVEQRSGKFFLVGLELLRAASAGMIGRLIITTWTRIRSSDEHEVGGIGGFNIGTADGDLMVF